MPPEYYGGKGSTPYLSKIKCSLSFQDKINIHLLVVDSSKICTTHPNRVQKLIRRYQSRTAEERLRLADD